MKTIWKYPLLPHCAHTMPAGAEILAVAAQSSDFCLWALVDDDREPQKRHFRVYGTGHPVDEKTPSKFLGTAFINGLVFHAFEVFPFGAPA